MSEREAIPKVLEVVEWYFRYYHNTAFDNGGPAMYCDRQRLGHFAARPKNFTAGDGATLFRLLVASTLFQRRQDQQVFRILRGLSHKQVESLARPSRLLAEARESPCEHLRTLDGLHSSCDLEKTPITRKGTCASAPRTQCAPKHHTVLLKRYSDFGKVPSSAALALYGGPYRGLTDCLRRITAHSEDRRRRSELLLAEVMRVWRVDVKIASMFLSAVTNPDLGGPTPPWTAELDWSVFVIVDSNVDRFLTLTGHRTVGQPYTVRRRLLDRLAAHVKLTRFRRGVTAKNTRLVQQAIYAFMSVPNRSINPYDCMHLGPSACHGCRVASVCPVRCGPRVFPPEGGRVRNGSLRVQR